MPADRSGCELVDARWRVSSAAIYDPITTTGHGRLPGYDKGTYSQDAVCEAAWLVAGRERQP